MKKILSILLSIILIVSLYACDTADADVREPINFYYCTDPETYQSGADVFTTEVRDAAGYDDHVSLINQYLKGPISDHLLSPFPAGVTVQELVQEEATIKIQLSTQFSRLTGSDLTIACAGLSMTLFELTGADTVEISVTDRTLDGNETVRISKGDLVFIDSSIAPPELNKLSIPVLYENTHLTATNRQIRFVQLVYVGKWLFRSDRNKGFQVLLMLGNGPKIQFPLPQPLDWKLRFQSKTAADWYTYSKAHLVIIAGSNDLVDHVA